MSCTQSGVIADLVRAEDRGREGSDEKSLNQLLLLSSVREATTDPTHPLDLPYSTTLLGAFWTESGRQHTIVVLSW